MSTKFKKSDDVKIIKQNETRRGYEDLYGEQGVVQYVRTYRQPHVDALPETTYYVAVSGRVNPNQVNGWFVYDEEDLTKWSGVACANGKPCVKISINKEENKNMFEKINVLDLHFEYKKDEIIKKYEKKERNLIKKDGIVAQVEAFKVQMKDVKGLTIYYNYDYPPELRDELEALHVKRDREIDLLRDERDDIKVVLQDCDTYEQKQAILKAYGVIDEQGKLIK